MTQRPELIIGFVAPVGVDVQYLCDQTADILRGFTYKIEEIRLSKLLERADNWKPLTEKGEDKRIKHFQEMAYGFRAKLKTSRAIALATLAKIRERRVEHSKNPDKPADGVAYLLNQLKHPEEVKLFREVYGSSFVLIAAHATQKFREEQLQRKIGGGTPKARASDDKARAAELIATDEEEIRPNTNDKYGQNSRGTYPLADIFVNAEQGVKATAEIKRFLYLLFGHPFHTPRPEEVAMYHASAASLRSSDESRQVGAIIAHIKEDKNNKTSDLEIISAGMNEVPRGGGGFYWDGSDHSPDARDQWLKRHYGQDRASDIKKSVLIELLDVLKKDDWLNEAKSEEHTSDLVDKLIEKHLAGTQFMNIGEFQRQVHAEMAAIIDSARRGVPVDGHTMYVTTFPCHNCAKHIIAAGIRKVVYLEPYPKSRVDDLHKEEIELNPAEGTQFEGKVIFSPYVGIAPRQYPRLFNMTGRGRKALYAFKEWEENKENLSPQYLQKNAGASHAQNERDELAKLSTDIFDWKRAIVCP